MTEFVESYRVSLLDEDHVDFHVFSVTVERRDVDLWAVCHIGSCLGKNGKWDYERSPSNRTKAWKNSHRFPLEEALSLARNQAGHMRINGVTAAEILDRDAS